MQATAHVAVETRRDPHHHILGLTHAVRPVHALIIHGGIPVRLCIHHPYGSCQRPAPDPATIERTFMPAAYRQHQNGPILWTTCVRSFHIAIKGAIWPPNTSRQCLIARGKKISQLDWTATCPHLMIDRSSYARSCMSLQNPENRDDILLADWTAVACRARYKMHLWRSDSSPQLYAETVRH